MDGFIEEELDEELKQVLLSIEPDPEQLRKDEKTILKLFAQDIKDGVEFEKSKLIVEEFQDNKAILSLPLTTAMIVIMQDYYARGRTQMYVTFIPDLEERIVKDLEAQAKKKGLPHSFTHITEEKLEEVTGIHINICNADLNKLAEGYWELLRNYLNNIVNSPESNTMTYQEVLEAECEAKTVEEKPAVAVLSPLTELARQINNIQAELQDSLKLTAQYARKSVTQARDIGYRLIEAKQRVKHGEWLKWLEDNCPSIQKRMIQRYMMLAKDWEKIESKYVLGTFLTIKGALKLLSEPEPDKTKTPNELIKPSDPMEITKPEVFNEYIKRVKIAVQDSSTSIDQIINILTVSTKTSKEIITEVEIDIQKLVPETKSLVEKLESLLKSLADYKEKVT